MSKQENAFTYDLFFSYRHKPLDSEVTEKMFNRVESYHLPESLRKQGYRDIERAFRDTEELAVSRVLTDTIDAALRSSRCLVIVCSTDTPSSEWVDREVATFLELGRADKIYPLLITGDPESSFPPSLKKVPEIASRIMDARCEGADAANVKKILEKADTEILKAIAATVGCREAELRREHKMRSRRQFLIRSAGAAAVLIAVLGISGAIMNLAQSYRDDAQKHADASLEIVRELTYGLPDHLTNIPGAYSRIADILEENTEDLNAVLILSGERNDVRLETAANFEKLANAKCVLGMYDEALASQEKAMEIYEELSGKSGNSTELPELPAAVASAYNNRGSILHKAGRYEEADKDYEQAIAMAPSGDKLLLAKIYGNAGANASDAGDVQTAEDYYEKSLAAINFTADNADFSTMSEDVLQTAALICRNEGVLFYRTGRYQDAEKKLETSCDLYAALLAKTDSLQNRNDYIAAVSALAACLTDEGQFDRADSYYEQAIAVAEELAADSENLTGQRLLAELYNNRGLCRNICGEYEEADTWYVQAARMRRGILEKTGTASDRAELALAILNTGENAFKSGDYKRTQSSFEEGLREYETACKELGSYDQAQYYAWRSYYALICLRDPAAALEYAVTACELQPDGVLPHLNLAYACFYSGEYEECDALMKILASLGDGQKETIRRDLEAQEKAGLKDKHTAVVLQILEEN